MKGVSRLLVFVLCMLVHVASAQNGVVQGTVLNEREEPVGNATVTAEPGGATTTTDASGKFVLSGLPKGNIRITASFVGYENSFEDVENESGRDRLVIFIGMKPRTSSRSEVVIIGYARQIRKDVTGNISKVRGADLTANPGLSFDAALQGKAPGVQVIQSGGVAGAGGLIRIRGIASVSANGEPLFVLDGLPINQDQFIQIGINGGGQQNNPLSFLNLADIESVEVFKDAGSSGIYGSRGANGVVFITTKRQAEKAPDRLVFTTSLGTSNPTFIAPMMDSKSWLSMYQEAWENDGGTGQAPLPDGVSWADATSTNTNWARELIRTGLKSETNASYAFRAGKMRIYSSLGYLNAQSYMKGNNFRRASGRINADWKLGRKTKMAMGLMLTDSRNNRQSQGAQGGLGAAYSVALPIFGKERETGFGDAGNPLLRLRYQDWYTDESRIIANLDYQTEIARNLIWEARGAYDRQILYDNLFIDRRFISGDVVAPSDRKSTSQLRSYRADNYLANSNLTYYIRRSSKTDYNLLGGIEYQGTGLESGQLSQAGLNRALEVSDLESSGVREDWEAWSFISAFARINARIANKLLLQGSFRRDASSRFGANNRWGNFPSAALGYIMSEEPWLKNVKWLNFLKFRAGWGQVGSSAIPNFIRWGTFGSPQNGQTYNNQSLLLPLNLANPDLRWEKCRIADAGFELSIIRNRVFAEFSVYDRLTNDVLLDLRLPASTGILNPNGQFRYFSNVGTVSNRGLEFSLSMLFIDRTDDRGRRKAWSIRMNGMTNRNQVLDMGFTDPDAIVGGGETRVINGQPMGVFYLVRYSHVDKATGKPVYLDKNGAQTFDYSLSNRVIAGNVQPKFIGYFENRVDIGLFTFSAAFYGVYGGMLYDEGARRQLTMLAGGNVREELGDRWQRPGDEAAFSMLSFRPQNYGGLDNVANYHTTQWLYDGSYLRLRELSVRYRFRHEKNNSGRKVRAGSLILSGFNLFLISKYPGDPEVVRDYSIAAQRNISPNVVNLAAPQERSIMLTLRLEM